MRNTFVVDNNSRDEDVIDVGFSRENERASRASRRNSKKRDRRDEWDDEDYGWN